MSINDILDTFASDSTVKSSMLVLFLVFMFGMLVKPYKDLPQRVDMLEASNSELRTEIQAQRRTLDLVVCFLETEAAGGNPLGCSR